MDSIIGLARDTAEVLRQQFVLHIQPYIHTRTTIYIHVQPYIYTHTHT
jgi:hypothetical protein